MQDETNTTTVTETTNEVAAETTNETVETTNEVETDTAVAEAPGYVVPVVEGLGMRARCAQKLLEIFKVGTTLTNEQIDQYVDVRKRDGSLGEYSWKQVWYMRKVGFKIDAVREGQKVVGYTLVAYPDGEVPVPAEKPAPAPEKVAELVEVKMEVGEAETKKAEALAKRRVRDARLRAKKRAEKAEVDTDLEKEMMG